MIKRQTEISSEGQNEKKEENVTKRENLTGGRW